MLEINNIRLKEGYSYLPDYNLVVNDEFESIFRRFAYRKHKGLFHPIITLDDIKKNAGHLKQVVLEVEQDCTLSCKYCIYNGEYHFERKRTDLHMTFEKAVRGLDYIYSILKNRFKKEFTISFYGGEPLLQFELIKQIVAYSKELFENWSLHYNITTNGTILDDQIIDFLISNEFSILISLDGPEKNQNAKRIYPNGKGSFKDIWGNLEKIKRNNEKFFMERISFSTVYSKDLS